VPCITDQCSGYICSAVVEGPSGEDTTTREQQYSMPKELREQLDRKRLQDVEELKKVCALPACLPAISVVDPGLPGLLAPVHVCRRAAAAGMQRSCCCTCCALAADFPVPDALRSWREQLLSRCCGVHSTMRLAGARSQHSSLGCIALCCSCRHHAGCARCFDRLRTAAAYLACDSTCPVLFAICSLLLAGDGGQACKWVAACASGASCWPHGCVAIAVFYASAVQPAQMPLCLQLIPAPCRQLAPAPCCQLTPPEPAARRAS
jgi:hypothetical protein